MLDDEKAAAARLEGVLSQLRAAKSDLEAGNKQLEARLAALQKQLEQSQVACKALEQVWAVLPLTLAT